jgi:hypothetical protein
MLDLGGREEVGLGLGHQIMEVSWQEGGFYVKVG